MLQGIRDRPGAKMPGRDNPKPAVITQFEVNTPRYTGTVNDLKLDFQSIMSDGTGLQRSGPFHLLLGSF
jgi:hypothetical protein